MQVQELPPLKNAAVLTLRPGDIVVIRCPVLLSADGVAHLRAALAKHIPAGHQVMILDGGLDLSVLRPEPVTYKGGADCGQACCTDPSECTGVGPILKAAS
jgi:hypothetical protein